MTEGSLWFAEKAFSKVLPKGMTPPMKEVLKGVEAGFSKIKDVLVSDIGGINNLFGCWLEGDLQTFHFFDGRLPPSTIVYKFLQTLGQTSSVYGVEIGDQVMIHMCKAITSFDTDLSLRSPGLTGGAAVPVLYINLIL
jgi:hypothetical protein